MTVAGIAMVRNEADIIGPIVTHMLTQVDVVLVADNLSTDGTRDILDSLPITVIDDPEPAYRQSDKMTALAGRAAEMGAEWVVPFDADEAWYSPFGRIADVLRGLNRVAIAKADLYNHVPTAGDDQDNPDPLTRIGWRQREKTSLPKVAVRTDPQLVIEMGNHGARYGTMIGRRVSGQLVVRHYPYRTADQFVTKALQGAEALRLTDLPDSAGAHWRQYADLADAQGPEALRDVFREWFWSADPTADPALIFDPMPLGGVR